MTEILQSGAVLLSVEAAWRFHSTRRMQRGALAQSCQENLSRLRASAGDDWEKSYALLLEILAYPRIGIPMSELETLPGNGSGVVKLVRVLERNQLVVCSTHTVLKHPYYAVEDLRKMLIKGLKEHTDYEKALRDLLQDLNNDSVLATTPLWDLPALAKLNRTLQTPSERDKVQALRRYFVDAITRLGDDSGHGRLSRNRRPPKEESELLYLIAVLGKDNDRAMEDLSMDKNRFYRTEKRAVKRLLQQLREGQSGICQRP